MFHVWDIWQEEFVTYSGSSHREEYASQSEAAWRLNSNPGRYELVKVGA